MPGLAARACAFALLNSQSYSLRFVVFTWFWST